MGLALANQIQKSNIDDSLKKHCFHCHLPIPPSDLLEFEDKSFCCNGCLSVFHILKTEGLDNYYELRRDQYSYQNLREHNFENLFLYLDDPIYREKFIKNKDGSISISFYLEGIHCFACIWLVEKVKERIAGINDVRFDSSTNIIKIKLQPKASLSQIATYFNNLGYRPHHIETDEAYLSLKRQESKKSKNRIALAALCAGNIMLFAISIYAGAEAQFEKVFSWLSGVLYLPIILICSKDFYRGAYNALKNKSLSIDLPITLAIIIGSIFSYYYLFIGSNQFYFDSLAVFVFLLLASRYLLTKAQQKGMSLNTISCFLHSENVSKLSKEDIFIQTHIKLLSKNDIISLSSNQTLPVDCTLESDNAFFNLSFLTGEHLPQKKEKGDYIEAGSTLIGESCLLKVSKTWKDSRVNQILDQIQDTWKSNYAPKETDLAATYLLMTAIILAVLTIIWSIFFSTFTIGMERALSILIITCPCALAIGTPLALSNALQSLLRSKIIVKNYPSLQSLGKSENIFFDKTGTLTNGSFEVISWDGDSSVETLHKIYSLESHSLHPIALTLKEYIKNKATKIQNYQVSNLEETLGIGIQGIIEGSLWKIEKNRSWKKLGSSIIIKRDNIEVCRVNLEDSIKKEATLLINRLHSQKINTFIITGDNKTSALKVSSELNIPQQNTFFDCSPEKKKEILKIHPKSIMAGDGLNDILAFNNANVAISIGGKVDINLKNSDIYLPNPDLNQILNLILYSKKLNKVIKRNILISLSYNTLGLIAAILGYITPLTAAIIMPLSSISVIVSSQVSTKYKTRENL